MTLRALSPKGANSAKRIGETIQRFAEGTISMAAVVQTIHQNASRGGVATTCKVSFINEVDLDHKIVVVPTADMIENELKEAGNQSHYDLHDQYISHAAKRLEERAKELAGRGPLAPQHYQEAVEEAAGKAVTNKEFLLMRLGEYCISQCK